MARQDNTGVDAAFEMLLEEIDSVVEEVNQSGGRAFSDGKLDVAQQILTQAQTLTDFRSNVASLRESWGDLYALQDEEVKAIVSKRDLGRLKKGLRTKEVFYYSPTRGCAPFSMRRPRSISRARWRMLPTGNTCRSSQ